MKEIFKKVVFSILIIISHFVDVNAQNAGSFILESGTFSNRVLADGVTPTNTYHNMTSTKFSSNDFLEFRIKNTGSNQVDMNFRILLPIGYFDIANANKKYPMIVMLHGAGESGISWGSTRIYAPTDVRYLNNDHQLWHGGMEHLAARNLASTNPSSPRAFEGIYLVGQNKAGWFESEIETLLNIVELVIQNYRVDKLRIYSHGLSNGGQGACVIARKRPDLFAAYLHMSAFNPEFKDYKNLVRIPSWQFQGKNDNAPTPAMSQIGVDILASMGGNHRYTLYPFLGHGTWEDAYDEPDFFSWILSKNKKYVHVFFGRTTFCTPTFPAVKIGVSQGFGYYQWYKDGVPIVGENKDSLMVTSYGNYNVVYKRKNIVYSPLRAQSGLDPDSVISDIVTFSASVTTAKPSIEFDNTYCFTGLDGTNSVTLKAPAGKAQYQWLLNGNPIANANQSTYTTSTLGSYTLKVTDLNQCESVASDAVVLNDGNPNISGSPAPKSGSPAAPSNLNATNLSLNSIRISWMDNSTNELGFELYRSANSGGPYQILKILSSNTTSFDDTNLVPGNVYFYRLRAFNNSGASLPTIDFKASTLSDLIAPTSPVLSLITNKTYPNSLSVSWTAATDNVGVNKYRISYFWGNNSPSTLEVAGNQLTATINGLQADKLYNISIKAIDLAGNQSMQSNQVSGLTKQVGVDFEFFEGGTWGVVADYDNWPASQTGRLSNFNINKVDGSPAGIRPTIRNDYFAYNFTGYIYISNPGLYTFGLSSDDGSLLFINNVKIVDYDGLHGAGGPITGSVNLSAGAHTIKVQFFERSGNEALSVTYRGPDVGNTLVPIPNSALVSSLTTEPSVPNAPSLDVPTSSLSNGIVNVNLTWANNTVGTQVEIYRRNNPSGSYSKLFTTSTNATSYIDNTVLASTSYRYYLRAINQNGASANSNTRDITSASSAGALNAPSGLVIAQQGQYLKLNWTDNSANESSFEIERSSSSNLGPFFLLSTPTFNTTQYIDNTVLAGQLYYYRVRAVNTGNQSAYTSVVSATAPTVPNNPTQLSLRILYSKGIELRWKDNADNERGFKIERSNTSGSGFVSIADSVQRDSINTSSGKFVTFRDETLAAGQTYYYRLRAFRGAGFSDYTAEVEVKMPEWISFVNIGINGTNAGGPIANFNFKWNNLNDTQSPARTNLLNDQNVGTNINLSTITGFGWHNSDGDTTTSNDGVIPNAMIKTLLFYDFSSTPLLRLSNLSPTKLYTLRFFPSLLVKNDQRDFTTTFSVTNSTDATVENGNGIIVSHKNNKSNFAEISSINTSSGEIDFQISKGVSSPNAVLNAFQIYCYDLPQKTFYANSTSNIQQLGAWSINSNGTGANPLSFKTARQIFRFQPNTTYTLTNNLLISGTDSKIILDSTVTLIIADGVTLNAQLELKNGSKLVFENTNILTNITSIHPNSTIEYKQSSAFNIPTLSQAFGNIILSGAGAKTIPNNMNIDGNLTVSCPLSAVSNAVINIKESILFTTKPNMPSGNGAISFNFIGAGSQYFQANGDTVSAKNITVAINSTLIQSPIDQASVLGSGMLKIFGDFTVNGNFNPATGTLYFAGSSQQNINGNINTYNITCDNSSTAGVVIANQANTSVSLLNTMELKQNTKFTSNDKLVFLSNENGTARLAKVNTGAIFNGKINLQRFVGPSKAKGFYLLGTPLKNQTLLDWNDDIKIQIPEAWGGAPNTSRWDVNTRRWVSYTSNQAVNPGSGVRVYMFESQFTNGAVTIDNFGEPIIGDGLGNVNGNFTIPLTRTANGGWNLIANPYPCEIDFENSGWDKTNINNSFYVWDPIASNYRAYVGSGGTNMSSGNTMGVSSKIGSSQAFMVVASNSGNITINENAKTSNFPIFYREKNYTPLLRIELSNAQSDAKDEILFRFSEKHQIGFEPDVDALKLDGPTLNLSSGSLAESMTINTRPLPMAKELIDLNVLTNLNSECEFSFSQVPELDSTTIYLIDFETQEYTPIRQGTTYHFSPSLEMTNAPSQRFKLAFVKNGTSDLAYLYEFKILSITPNPFSEQTKLVYNTNQLGSVDVHITNSLGIEVAHIQATAKLGINSIDLSNFSSLSGGVYFTTIKQNGKYSTARVIFSK